LAHLLARFLRAILAAVAIAVASQAAVSAADDKGLVTQTIAEELTELPGLSRLAIHVPDRRATTLEALVIRPDGPGPFPLALMTNGVPRRWANIPPGRPEIYFSPVNADAARKPSTGVHLLYAANKAVCSAMETYLQRIDHYYPRRTQRERGLLLDPFRKLFRPLLPPELGVPTPIEELSFEDNSGGPPAFALYAVPLKAGGTPQLISVNDLPLGPGVRSILYLFKPGVKQAAVFEVRTPPPDDVANAIGADDRKYRSIPAALYFLDKLYSDTDQKKPVDWRILHHHLAVGGSDDVTRLFVWHDTYFILYGPPLFSASVVFKITPEGEFLDTCYYSRYPLD
jgi:hypothetical protein